MHISVVGFEAALQIERISGLRRVQVYLVDPVFSGIIQEILHQCTAESLPAVRLTGEEI